MCVCVCVCVCVYTYSSIIYNSQDVKAADMSIDEWIKKMWGVGGCVCVCGVRERNGIL